MWETKEESRDGRSLCDLVYDHTATQSRCSTIHRFQGKGRLSSAPSASKFHKSNRRTIDLKNYQEEEYPISCYKYKRANTDKLTESTFHQTENKPQITRLTISQLKGLTPHSTKRSQQKIIKRGGKVEKMIGFKPRQYGKKENKKGYQRQKQRIKASNSKLCDFFSNYERVHTQTQKQQCLDSLRNEIIRKYSGKFKLLQNL